MANKKSITATQVMELVKQQGFTCAISGRKLTPETASLDHIVPLGRGGQHSIENVWVVDHKVNIAKGTMSVEEFVSMCREVVTCQDQKKKEQAVDPTRCQEPKPEMGPPTKKLF